MRVEKIFLASDHGGFEAKEFAKKVLSELGFEIVDLGTNSTESVDYPEFGKKLAAEVAKSPNFYGVLACGTGIGISIAANRNPKIRCALCHNATEAALSREHNDANVVAFGGRILGKALIEDILRVFFDTEFAGGRHARRVEKLGEI